MTTDVPAPRPASPETASAGQRVGTVGIVCESVSCLEPATVAGMGIQVVPIPFVIDGRTYLDGVDVTADEVYAYLERTGRAPTTSAPSPAAYLDAFRAAGTESIICVTVSAAVSTTGERCRMAIDQARQELPGLRVTLFDSGAAAMAQGLLALAAAGAAAGGAAQEDVLALLRRRRGAAHLLIVLDTLKYLAQTGRLRGVAALAGGMLSIKPVVHVHDDGFAPLEVCRTRKRAVERMLDWIARHEDTQRLERLVVQHAAAPGEAEQVCQEAMTRFPGVAIDVVPFSPVMGTYAGPGLLGFAWLGPEGQAG